MFRHYMSAYLILPPTKVWLSCLCLPQYKEGKKLKPKPNYNSVDLSEVEWEDTEEKVSNTHSHRALVNFVLMLVSSA